MRTFPNPPNERILLYNKNTDVEMKTTIVPASTEKLLVLKAPLNPRVWLWA